MSISNGIRTDTLGTDTLAMPQVGLCSPDGKKAVFAEQASTSTVSPTSGPESDDLYVQTDNGTKKLKDAGGNSNDTDESYPAFSPDSEKLAFMRDSDIYVANADGTDQTNLTEESGGGSYPVWWSDSEKIAFTLHEDIYTINRDGTRLTQLTNNAHVAGNYYTLSGGNLVISPDAKKIAFLGLGADAPEGGGKPFYDLYVINADGSGLTNLSDKVTRYNKATGATVSVDYLGRHLFSPDSKQIAFVRSSYVPTRSVPLPSYDYDLYAVNVDGTDLTRLTNTEDWEGIITWVWK